MSSHEVPSPVESPAPTDASMDSVRNTVIEAADQLFYERGIQQVGMDELRAAAGVSLKRLYAEFEGKDAIVLAVLRRRHAMWVRGIDEAADRYEGGREKLLGIFDFLATWFATDDFRGCAFINAFGELGGSSERVAQAAREHKQSFQTYVDGLVADLGAPETLARQLVLLAEGAQTTSAITGDPTAAQHAREAAEVLIAAATAPA
ncbi:TetR/AcrR family transcriptional regulator [Williamsia serinedens]|uniref:Transcriptional regulator, TetR family n=1 Tax=Williamsia serinedens TaxID=391736 RepID=A0ABT1GZU1_9NOCA|nr:TetR/AcrR family transcriptional regulator [Williamsia serinedens]MCP2159783.1 transcriptional regulator, TetR family [Williamsia serinedens]